MPGADLKPIPMYDVNTASNNQLLLAGDPLATGNGVQTPLLALGAFEGKGKSPLEASNRIPKKKKKGPRVSYPCLELL